ncbi:LTA synthase family protein [Ferruginibacter sp.]|uniref:LTA synthase family protein n=1 Tax=Ferruginibacter sp. TaxID=1940288 RepID=UPI00265A560E|nr:sulfatase-like hydrolase/transferase [Ferruginibacter sp.]
MYDIFCIALIHLPLFIFISAATQLVQKKLIALPLLLIFTLADTLLIVLNLADIFYFRFHLQRADADLLYVLRNPFANSTFTVLLLVLLIVSASITIAWIVHSNLSKLLHPAATGKPFILTLILLLLFTLLFFWNGTKKTLPSYPLTQLEPVQLPLAQNSFHTFIYSLYRQNETALPAANYMSPQQAALLFPAWKKNKTAGVTDKKNIVLFIMESIPYDFFDKSSPYKVAMPFIDSLVNKSTFFSNAFSFSYSSNKGITAILAGLPTLTDIPLYHSNFLSMERSEVGKLLAKNNYSSSFFIGDNYDDMGFAQCCKWLGIQHYYCMKDIPGYRQMEKHSLGLHDEYVLSFMQQKIAAMQQPFFAAQYNISTHYPNDLPKSFNDRYPRQNTTPSMKTMAYYNDCLQQFFKEAATKNWYKNTVFIFCADHWATPDADNVKLDETSGFRIPVFIYEPGKETKRTIASPVSQLDVVNTILQTGSKQDSVLSYGTSLTDTILQPNRTVFTKMNNAVYEAINNEYVLGFNAIEGKSLYYFDYLTDTRKQHNLLSQPRYTTGIDSMALRMKAFLQTASAHYRNKHISN